MEIDKIFVGCLKQPVFARVEYLEAEQVKSNFSKKTFLKVLYNKWKEYRAIVFKSDLEKPFDELVKEKGFEYATSKVYGDEPEPFEHIYSGNEINEIETENIFTNSSQNNLEWLNENILWLLRDYINRLFEKWNIEQTNPHNQNETPTDNKISTKELENCLHLIGYWLNEDEAVIQAVVNDAFDFERDYLIPFSKELNANLLYKDTYEAKRDLLRYYIFEFFELQAFFIANKKIIEHKPDKDGNVRFKNTDEVKTDFEKYTILCFIYNDIIFNEIQLCCIKYKIDFFEICFELKFPLHSFDSGITLAFQQTEIETANKAVETIEPETVLTDYIEKYLCEYKDAFITESDYEKAIKVLNSFFNGTETNIDKPILIKRGYTKHIAFALGEIWRSKKTDVITYEYLMLYKKLFSIFQKQRLEENHVFSSPLYKYSISKT
jgi:hypothetical protein